MGWAKKGQRLRIPTNSSHNRRLNIFGWVAPLLGKKGLIQMPHGNRKGFIACLRNIYKRLKGYRIWLYVDRARWHRGEGIDIFLKTHVRLRLEYLPSYQPGLNMQERIWRQVRYEITTNRWFDDLDVVWDNLQHTIHSWTPDKIKRLCKFT